VTDSESRRHCRRPGPIGDHHEVQVRTPTREFIIRAPDRQIRS
jgi:hypothetical protein